MREKQEKIVDLLFQHNQKDKAASMIVLVCCQTKEKADMMIEFLQTNIQNGLTRREILDKADEIQEIK